MVRIRAATVADAPAVAAVRRASWFAAYSGLIDAAIIDRVTGPDDADRIKRQLRGRPQRTTIVACTDAIVGFATFGPEREVNAGWPAPETAAGAAGQIGELYALYVHPDWWSTGAGRALMERALGSLRRTGFAAVVLWVLEQNARARRFYEVAGFAADGAVNTLHGLGGVTEVRYRRVVG
jgi:GNAT superfamily N-acetyltransferase